MEDDDIKQLLKTMRERGLRIVTAESLTCGLIAGTLTEISGASSVVNGAFGVYTNATKTKVLGVPADMLAQFTAVSEPVARAMAEGALRNSVDTTNIAIAVTGYAGSPGGEAPESEAGTVYMGLAWNFEGAVKTEVFRHQFPGGRKQVRQQTIDAALGHVRDLLKRTV